MARGALAQLKAARSSLSTAVDGGVRQLRDSRSPIAVAKHAQPAESSNADAVSPTGRQVVCWKLSPQMGGWARRCVAVVEQWGGQAGRTKRRAEVEVEVEAAEEAVVVAGREREGRE